jgi:hypothetical protein
VSRRLAWRELVVDRPGKGKRLLETLRECPVLGANVRSIGSFAFPLNLGFLR